MSDASGRIAITAASAGHASTYAVYGATAPFSLTRYRMAVSDTTSILSSFQIATLAQVSNFALALSAGVEHAVVSSPSGVSLYETPSSDAATSSSMLGPIAGLPTDVFRIAAATAEQNAAIGGTNPLAIAMIRPSPNGALVSLVTSLAPLTASTPILLPGSAGAASTGSALSIVAAPGGGVARFFVAAMDDGGSSSTLRVWEVISQPPSARQIVIADDWSFARSTLSMAVSGTTVRLVEQDNTNALVSRAIGCR